MNIIELQDNLKDLPDRVLMQEMQMPTGNMPQFLVLSELTRRRRMRDEYNRQKAADMPTVAEEVMTAAGAPQGGITAIARNMAPNSSIAQNTGADMAVQREPTRMPQKMSGGGVLRLNQGFKLSSGTSISDQLLPARIGTVLRGGMGNANDRMVIAEQVLTGVYGPELQSQFTSNMLAGNYGDDLKNIAEQFNTLTNQEETSLNSVSTEIEDFAPTIDFNASDRGFEPTNAAINPETVQMALPAAVSQIPVQGRTDVEPIGKLRADQLREQFDEIIPASNIDAAQQISYQSGKEPFRRFGANYYDLVRPPEGKEMRGDRDRIMATAGEIFPTYLQRINQQINASSPSVVASEPTTEEQMLAASGALNANYTDPVNLETESEKLLREDVGDFDRVSNVLTDPKLSMDELMRQAQIEREGFGAVMQNPTQEIPYNPVTSVIDYNPRNTGEAQFQLETEQAYNKKLYTDRLAIERRIQRLKEVAETPNDFERLAALEAQLNSMGGSTAENPTTAQLTQAELNFGKFVMDDREAAVLAPVARDVKVVTDTVQQLQQSLEVADNENKPIIEQRLQEELAKLSQAQNNLNAVESTLELDPTEEDISTVPSVTEILSGDAPSGAVTVPDKVSGGTKTVVKDDVFRTPIGNFNDAELATVGGEQTIVPSGISGDDPYNEISPTELSNVLGQTTGTGLSLEDGIESLLPPSLTGDVTSDGTGDGTGDGLGGDTGGGASSTVGDSYSALESRIAKMLDDREKSAESDKFLALAQAGLALMASDSPTLGGAIGEAGLVGVSQLRDARNQYDKDILGLLSTQADIDAARSDASLAKRKLDLQSRGLDLEEAALDTTGMKPGDLLDYLASLQKQQTTLSEQIDKNLAGDNDIAKQILLNNRVEIERIKKLLGYGSSTKDLAD